MTIIKKKYVCIVISEEIILTKERYLHSSPIGSQSIKNNLDSACFSLNNKPSSGTSLSVGIKALYVGVGYILTKANPPGYKDNSNSHIYNLLSKTKI